MSTMVGMGAEKKAVKDTEGKFKKENKELAAVNKALLKENETLRDRIAELEAERAEKPEETPRRITYLNYPSRCLC